MVTLTAVAEGLRADFPALADACLGAATPQIRNAATLAGNLCQRPRCWYFRSAEFQCLKKGGAECLAKSGENEFHAIFGNDTCAIVHPSAAGVALVALNARIETLAAGGGRTLAAADFFQRPEVDIFAENALKPGELVVEIHVDRPQSLRSAYRKIKQKQAFDWPLADAAVAWRDEGGVAKDVRIVIGSAAPVPWRAKAAEALVEGKKIDAALAAKAGEAALRGRDAARQERLQAADGRRRRPPDAPCVGRASGRDGGARMSAPTGLGGSDAVALDPALRCRHLRTKTMFVATGDWDEHARQHPSTSAAYWCLQVMGPVGPDGQPACLDDCRAGRACFEGED